MTSSRRTARGALTLPVLLLIASFAIAGCSGSGTPPDASDPEEGASSAPAEDPGEGEATAACEFTEVPADSAYAAYIETVEVGGTDLHLAPELLPTSREPDCVFAVTYNEEGNGAVESYAVYFPVDDALFAESVAVVEAAGFTYQSRTRPEYDPASGFWGGSTGPDLTGDYVLISNGEASQLAADWGIQLPADVSIAMVHYTALADS